MRTLPPPLSVTLLPPSMTIFGPLSLKTLAVFVERDRHRIRAAVERDDAALGDRRSRTRRRCSSPACPCRSRGSGARCPPPGRPAAPSPRRSGCRCRAGRPSPPAPAWPAPPRGRSGAAFGTWRGPSPRRASFLGVGTRRRLLDQERMGPPPPCSATGASVGLAHDRVSRRHRRQHRVDRHADPRCRGRRARALRAHRARRQRPRARHAGRPGPRRAPQGGGGGVRRARRRVGRARCPSARSGPATAPWPAWPPRPTSS